MLHKLSVLPPPRNATDAEDLSYKTQLFYCLWLFGVNVKLINTVGIPSYKEQ